MATSTMRLANIANNRQILNLHSFNIKRDESSFLYPVYLPEKREREKKRERERQKEKKKKKNTKIVIETARVRVERET